MLRSAASSWDGLDNLHLPSVKELTHKIAGLAAKIFLFFFLNKYLTVEELIFLKKT